jgi:Protein of unknown function (DUF2795)/Zinc finger, C2H2 type
MASSHPQFKCPFCGKGFEQKSKLNRHTETAHPPSAPSAADLERLLGGIKYPKSKQELQSFATQRISTGSPELLILVSSLPDRIYRDAAEVGVALGELKSGKRPRSSAQIAKLEPPSKRGGKNALISPSISAARIASVLKGIDFPKSKRSVIMYARRQSINQISSGGIISVLRRISDKTYRNMAELEKEIGKIK